MKFNIWTFMWVSLLHCLQVLRNLDYQTFILAKDVSLWLWFWSIHVVDTYCRYRFLLHVLATWKDYSYVPWFQRSCICRQHRAQQHEEGRSWTWGQWSTASQWGSSPLQCQKQSPLGTGHQASGNGRNLSKTRRRCLSRYHRFLFLHQLIKNIRVEL